MVGQQALSDRPSDGLESGGCDGVARAIGLVSPMSVCCCFVSARDDGGKIVVRPSASERPDVQR